MIKRLVEMIKRSVCIAVTLHEFFFELVKRVRFQKLRNRRRRVARHLKTNPEKLLESERSAYHELARL